MAKNVHSAIEVFYSYASNGKDDKWQSEIEQQLSTLKRSGLITDWHAHKIVQVSTGRRKPVSTSIPQHLFSC